MKPKEPKEIAMRWADPPVSAVWMSELMAEENLRRWAIVMTFDALPKASAYATRICSGSAPRLPDTHRFEAVACTTDGEHRIYARCLGPKKAHKKWTSPPDAPGDSIDVTA